MKKDFLKILLFSICLIIIVFNCNSKASATSVAYAHQSINIKKSEYLPNEKITVLLDIHEKSEIDCFNKLKSDSWISIIPQNKLFSKNINHINDIEYKLVSNPLNIYQCKNRHWWKGGTPGKIREYTLNAPKKPGHYLIVLYDTSSKGNYIIFSSEFIVKSKESISIKTNNTPINQYNILKTDIILNNSNNSYMQSFKLSYDKNLLQYAGYENIPDSTCKVNINEEKGELKFIVKQNNLNYIKKLISINFVTKKEGIGKIKLLEGHIKNTNKEVLEVTQFDNLEFKINKNKQTNNNNDDDNDWDDM